MTLPTPSPCPGCSGPITAAFCPDCGEARHDPRKRNLVRFLLGWLDATTSLDGRFLGSFRVLLLRPGELTASYQRGIRRRYLTPMQVVLFANLILFLVQPIAGAAVLNTPYASHTQNQVYSGWARAMVQSHLATTGRSEQELVPRFDRRADDASRTLVLLLVPLYAVVFAIVRVPGRRSAIEHLAFAAEFVAFAATYFLGGLLLVMGLLQGLATIGIASGPAAALAGNLPAVAAIAVAAWLVLAVRKLYGDRWLPALLRSVAVCSLTIVTLTVYRFVLFVVALKTA